MELTRRSCRAWKLKAGSILPSKSRELAKHVAITTAIALVSSVMPAHADEFTDALKSAYETNPRIQAQRRALEQTNEQVSQAIGQFRPTASATYQNGRQRNSFNDSNRVEGDVENKSLSVTQPIFLGGANIFRYLSTKDAMRANRGTLGAIEQEVLLDAVVAYMNVVQSHSILELSRNNENVLAQQLEASKQRFQVGDVTRTDVAQSGARLARARSDTIQAQGDLESALAQFERVVGYIPENLPLPVPADIPAMPLTLEAAVERAVENNPSLRATEYNKESAEDDIGVAVASILPQVTIQGNINRQDGVGALGLNVINDDQLLLNVTVPIYQNGSEYSAVRQSRLVAKQREFELLDTQQQIKEATIQAWENLTTALATIKAQEEQVEAAQVALDGVRQEHKFGARTVLDVLDAEQELFVAQVDLVRAQRNRYVSTYNLLLVLGDLTIENVGIDTQPYDPEDHYDSVKWQLIGF